MVLFIIVLVAVGIVLALVRGWMDPTIYKIIIVLVVLAAVLYILSAFGLVSLPSQLQVGKGR